VDCRPPPAARLVIYTQVFLQSVPERPPKGGHP
jgi:hypothetical protein